MSDIVFLDGRLQPISAARIPVGDRGFRYGEGVFETLRARGDKVFRAPAHLLRLQDSAAALDWELPWGGDELLDAVRQTVAANGHPESRVRIQATRGPGDPDSAPGPPTLLVEATAFATVPAALRECGVDLSMAPYRISSAGVAPSGKTTSYVLNLLARSAARAGGAFEALLCNEAGEVCEAAMANVFLLQGSTLRTPPTGSPALPGVTRGVVLEIARGRADLDVREERLRPDDLFAADEMFLTSTGVEILAVRALEGRPIGPGRPGPVTRWLHTAYGALLDDELGTVAG